MIPRNDMRQQMEGRRCPSNEIKDCYECAETKELGMIPYQCRQNLFTCPYKEKYVRASS